MTTIDLVTLILAQYSPSVEGIHGITHWGRVLENGRRLAPITGADLGVVELFAIFHDSRRFRDGLDPEHGPRAAALARDWRDRIELDDARFELLLEACDCHTRGARSNADATVCTCLDADRLDIPRVGMRIDPHQLFTEAARDPRVISWANARATRMDTPRVCAEEWGWPRARS